MIVVAFVWNIFLSPLSVCAIDCILIFDFDFDLSAFHFFMFYFYFIFNPYFIIQFFMCTLGPKRKILEFSV